MRFNKGKFVVFGREFKSRDAAIKYHGLNKATTISRIKSGMTNDQAFHKEGLRAVKYKGKTYKSLRMLSEKLKVPLHTLKKRLREGLTLEQALKEPFASSKKILFVGNDFFESQSDACAHFGIDFVTYKARLKLGWSIEEAMGVTKRADDFCNGLVYVIKNRENHSVYVGVTTGCPKIRFNTHMRWGQTYPKTKFQKAIYELGRENFKMYILAQTNSLKELKELEVKFIERYDSIKNGYNTVRGGATGRIKKPYAVKI